MLDIIHVGVRFLAGAPVVGGLFGFLTYGLLGAVISAVIIAVVVIAVIAAASVMASRRLPIQLCIIPDPTGSFVRVSGQWKSPVVSGWASGQLKATNFGTRDIRITGLRVEFRRLIWGVIPETVHVGSYRSLSEPYTEIDWLLPAGGKRETRSVMLEGYAVGKNAKPGDILDVRIVAEVGSHNRYVYIEFPVRAEVRPPYVAGGR